MTEQVSSQDWMRYALTRIRMHVNLPREDMSEDQLSIFTFAQNALAGGDPVMRVIARGPGMHMCRICLAEWGQLGLADHVHGCPMGSAAAP